MTQREIEAKLRSAESYGYPSFMLATADVAYLLAELRKAQDKLGRVEGLHQVAYKAVEKWAEGYRFTGEHCAFDGEHWPCMTFRAAVADATGGGDS